MKKQGRYSTSGLVDDQYMPGSKGKVLRNLLGITTKKEIDRFETELLFEITDQLLDEFDNTRQFSADDILEMHRRWLGSVFEWAGVYHCGTLQLDRNYKPMANIFADIIARSLQVSEGVGWCPLFNKYFLTRGCAAIPSIAEDEHTEMTRPDSRFSLSRK